MPRKVLRPIVRAAEERINYFFYAGFFAGNPIHYSRLNILFQLDFSVYFFPGTSCLHSCAGNNLQRFATMPR